MTREVWPHLLKLLEERVAVGEKRYGCRLATENGRDALGDLWEELADALMYATQEMMERDDLKAENERLRQALRDYGDHDAGCPRRYVQPTHSAGAKTEGAGTCECGLDDEIGQP